jgi:hypothetical protein
MTASMLRSHLEVESLLVSALPTTSSLPKTHVLNQRAMEILREVVVVEAIPIDVPGFAAEFTFDTSRAVANLI